MRKARGLAAGLGAGALATYVLGIVYDAIYRRESPSVHRREAQLEDHSAPQVLGEKLLRAVGRQPSEAEIKTAGKAVHWIFGVTNGLIFSLVVHRCKGQSVVLGLPFGLALYAVHLFGVPALNLSPPSRAFPSQTRVRGLAYHAAYGAVLGLVYAILAPSDSM
ncbi:MAG: DUF1440 domain-containing protein [Candidatus Eremiobacteraeota bacterium]|nr:DUF1440 domain-containing protein [Candidatus Eremiobacteraeota bacterium]